MSQPNDSRGEEPEGLMVARITIERRLTDDDLIDYVITENGQGDALGIVEALGMLRLAEDTLLQNRDEDDE